MKIMIIGSGGREHTIAWKLSKSSRVEKLYCAPGNGGIGELAECVPIGVMEFDRQIAFANAAILEGSKAFSKDLMK